MNTTPHRRQPRVAFVAGGGAIKAYAFHLGVLVGLQESGFHFRSGTRWNPIEAPPGSREIDTYVGSSAGGCVAAGLVSGQPIDEMRRAILGTSSAVPSFGYRVMFAPIAPHPWRYASRMLRRYKLGILRPAHLLDVGGLITAAGMERYFRRYVLPTNRFTDLHPNLFLVSTQVNGARKVVFGPSDSLGESGYGAECAFYDNVEISEALAAAVSLPPLFAPFAITNAATGKVFHYYDGEVREPLSLNVAREVGASFTIASSIWRPYSYVEHVGSLAEFGMMTLAEQALHQSIEQKVARERALSRQVERALDAIRELGGGYGLMPREIEQIQDRVASELQYRKMRVLYVAPEPRDAEFFFQGSFRFSPDLIGHCVDAGYRAFEAARIADAGFFEELDSALQPLQAEAPVPATTREGIASMPPQQTA